VFAVLCIISDIHGNLEALESVLAEGDSRGVDEWICLGDVVGYGANPNECVDLIRERCSVVLLGNHDEAAATDADLSRFNPWAARAALWTRHTLEPTRKAWLAERPLRHESGDATYVHSTPLTPERWRYIMHQSDADANAHAFNTPLCFVGHSHTPGVFDVRTRAKSTVARAIVNVGSVGQPRDADPRACMVLLPTEMKKPTRHAIEIEFVRVGYDIKGAQVRIIAAGLPTELATRLALGL